MYRAGHGVDPVAAACARSGSSVVEAFTVDAPKTKLLAQKLKGLGLDGTVLIITDSSTRTCSSSSRNLPNVLVLEAREADPVSLVRFDNVLVTKARGRRSSRRCSDERPHPTSSTTPSALMKVLLAPVDLGEGHVRRRQARAGRVPRRAGRDQARDQGRGRADVQGQKVEVARSRSPTCTARRSASAASSAAGATGRRRTCA